MEDNPGEQLSIKALLDYDDIDVSVVSTGADAIEAVTQQAFDCVVLDLRLPDISGFEVLERFAPLRLWPICQLWFSPARNFRRKKMPVCTHWRAASWLKVWSRPSVLLDETALFLHRVVADLPDGKAEIARPLASFR